MAALSASRLTCQCMPSLICSATPLRPRCCSIRIHSTPPSRNCWTAGAGSSGPLLPQLPLPLDRKGGSVKRRWQILRLTPNHCPLKLLTFVLICQQRTKASDPGTTSSPDSLTLGHALSCYPTTLSSSITPVSPPPSATLPTSSFITDSGSKLGTTRSTTYSAETQTSLRSL